MAGDLSSALLHELADALTAVDNYAAAARCLAARERAQKQAELAATLERLSGQVRRALDAVRGLQALRHLPAGGEGAG